MPSFHPPPQGSRAGLITSLVIFVILWIGSTLVAMHFHTEWLAEIVKHNKDVEDLKPGVTADVLGSDEVKKFIIDNEKAAEEAAKNGGAARPKATAVEEALQQRNKLVTLIAGRSNAGETVDHISNQIVISKAAATAVLMEKDSVDSPDKTHKVPSVLLTDNLPANHLLLATRIGELADALKAANIETASAKEATAKAEAGLAAAVASKQADIDAAVKKAADSAEANVIEAKAYVDKVKERQDEATAGITLANAGKDVASAETKKVERDLKLAQAALQKVTDQYNKFHVGPSSTRALLQPAGMITRVPGNNTVFINLGEGKQIWPGLTFEVYDKKKGLPSLTVPNPDSPDDLLPGKASIEVVRVLPDTSECRIVHTAKGMTILEGDLVLNLIYNLHSKFAFYIYGAFDVGNTGPATIEGRDVLRRLVTQWGGRSMDRIGIDTDFVVLGKEVQEPVKPENPTAVDDDKYNQRMKEYQEYMNVMKVAGDLHIPILNQNRFLYMIGYYDQKNR